MSSSPDGRRQGAAQTEYIVLVSVLSLVVLAAAVLYGSVLSRFLGRGTQTLAKGPVGGPGAGAGAGGDGGSAGAAGLASVESAAPKPGAGASSAEPTEADLLAQIQRGKGSLLKPKQGEVSPPEPSTGGGRVLERLDRNGGSEESPPAASPGATAQFLGSGGNDGAGAGQSSGDSAATDPPSPLDRIDALTKDGGFSAGRQKFIHDIFNRLPPAFQSIPFAKIRPPQKTTRNIANFNPKDNAVVLPDAFFVQDSLTDFQNNVTNRGGDGKAFTRTRILFHELAHALHENDPKLANELLDAEGGFNKTKKARHDAVQKELDKIKKKIQELEQELNDGKIEGTPYFERQRQLAAEEEKLLESNGFPSRFPGDLEAFQNDHEYFAVLAELFRFDKKRWERYKQQGVISPEEAQWFEDHSTTFRGK